MNSVFSDSATLLYLLFESVDNCGNPMLLNKKRRLESIVDANQLNPELLSRLFSDADKIRSTEMRRPKKNRKLLEGKVMATLFYEPSTRTRFSFESAMIKLGGSVISSENAGEFSSAAKGEKLEDTIRVVSSYADCIVIRHREDGAAATAARVSTVPVINGGDGKSQHPTQAMLDMYTIKTELGRLDNFRIAMVGDLAYGRTVKSLAMLLAQRKGIELLLVAPESLRMDSGTVSTLRSGSVKVVENAGFEKALAESDIIYMTRLQKERMREDEYEASKSLYIIDEKRLSLVDASARVMHPLPHVEEIDLPIDVEKNDKRVAYFRQAENGLYVRMALLKELLRK